MYPSYITGPLLAMYLLVCLFSTFMMDKKVPISKISIVWSNRIGNYAVVGYVTSHGVVCYSDMHSVNTSKSQKRRSKTE